MQAGDAVEVRNINGDQWGKGKIVHVVDAAAGIYKVQVKDPGHELDGKIITVDSDHCRAAGK